MPAAPWPRQLSPKSIRDAAGARNIEADRPIPQAGLAPGRCREQASSGRGGPDRGSSNAKSAPFFPVSGPDARHFRRMRRVTRRKTRMQKYRAHALGKILEFPRIYAAGRPGLFRVQSSSNQTHDRDHGPVLWPRETHDPAVATNIGNPRKQPANGLLRRRVASRPVEGKNGCGTGLAPQHSGPKLPCYRTTGSIYTLFRGRQGSTVKTVG
jgi:hypothetical protein